MLTNQVWVFNIYFTLVFFYEILYAKSVDFLDELKTAINRKFRVPRKQGAHFLGARAQIQDSWVFSSSV
jgi:hypothetical protein